MSQGKRTYDEIGNEIKPQDSKGKKLGLCGHPLCSVVMAKWTHHNYGFVCETCAKDANRLWGEGTCTLADLSVAESSDVYKQEATSSQEITPVAESFETIAKRLKEIEASGKPSSGSKGSARSTGLHGPSYDEHYDHFMSCTTQRVKLDVKALHSDNTQSLPWTHHKANGGGVWPFSDNETDRYQELIDYYSNNA